MHFKLCAAQSRPFTRLTLVSINLCFIPDTKVKAFKSYDMLVLVAVN